MQLSLPPVPAYPTPPASNAGNGSTPAPTGDAATPAGDSFDSFLPSKASNEKPASAETGPDGEKAAAILAAFFWMPAAPVVNPAPLAAPSLTSALSSGIPSAEPVDGANAAVLPGCFGQTSSRSFGAVAQAMSGTSPQAAASEDIPVAMPSVAAENPAAALPGGMSKLETAVQMAAAMTTAVKGQGTMIANAVTGLMDVKSTATDSAISKDSLPATLGNFTQEKIAPLPSLPADDLKNSLVAQEKFFLDPIQKAVTAANAGVGIAVAKLNATMSAAAFVRPKSASISESPASFAFAADNAPIATLTIDAPAPVASVRETMAAVISAVDALERRADVQHKSVDLQFQVGGEKLGLRVELRDGTVYTTFRTESPEMNGALAREWHSVVPPALAREIRLADPVFNSAPAGESSSLLGQGSPQQREQQKAAPTFASAHHREFIDSAVPESTTGSPAVNSSQLFNAIA